MKLSIRISKQRRIIYEALFVFKIVFFLTVRTVYGQDERSTLLVYGSISSPTGDFGKKIGENPRITRRLGFDIGEDVGLVNTGYAFGAEFSAPTGIERLGWVISTIFIMNKAEESKVRSEFEHQLGDTVDIAFDFGNWINIPIMTGFKYQVSISPLLDIYSTVQAGINLTKAASRKASLTGTTPVTVQGASVNRTFSGETVEETTFDFTRDIGFGFGGGLVFNKRITIGLRYLELGTPTYEGTRRLSELYFTQIVKRETRILGEDRRVSMFLFFIGINL